MRQRDAAEVFPVQDFLRDELAARGWSHAFFSERTRIPLPVVNRLLAGDKPVTSEIATAMGRALGTSAELWLRLDLAYRTRQQALKPNISRNNPVVGE